MKLKIHQKAYELDLSKLSEGFLSSEIILHAENRNKARHLILEKVKYDDWKLYKTDEELSYLNIPVIRCESADKVYFEDKIINKGEIKFILEKREKIKYLQSIKDNESITHCYIIKRGSYYRPGYCGYTESVIEAGVYSKDEAISHSLCCDELSIHPIDKEIHNKLILNKIEELKNNLI